MNPEQTETNEEATTQEQERTMTRAERRRSERVPKTKQQSRKMNGFLKKVAEKLSKIAEQDENEIKEKNVHQLLAWSSAMYKSVLEGLYVINPRRLSKKHMETFMIVHTESIRVGSVLNELSKRITNPEMLLTDLLLDNLKHPEMLTATIKAAYESDGKKRKSILMSGFKTAFSEEEIEDVVTGGPTDLIKEG